MASSAIPISAPSVSPSTGSDAGAGAGAGAAPAQPSPAKTASRTSTAKSTRFTYTSVKDEDGKILHFVCPECGAIKRNQPTMHYHMKKHLEEKDFKCNQCQKAFLNKQGLEVHKAARHPATAPVKGGFECPFEGCSFISPTKGNVRTHCMRKHFAVETNALLERDTETNTLGCTVCTETFSSPTAFFYHAIRCIEIPHTDPRAPALDIIL